MTKFLSMVKLLALARRLRDRALRPVMPRVTTAGPAPSGSSEFTVTRPGGRKNL